jgi:hypothetical protein
MKAIKFLLLAICMLFLFSCEKEDTVSTTPEVTFQYKEVILDSALTANILELRAGPENIFAQGNVVWDNALLVSTNNKRTFIVFQIPTIKDILLEPNSDNGEADIQGIYSRKYNVVIRWKDFSPAMVFNKCYSRHQGNNTFVYTPLTSNNVLPFSNTLKAVKYVFMGSGPMITHPMGDFKVPIGIYQRWGYLNNKWLLLETVNLHPNNKGTYFNVPLLM